MSIFARGLTKGLMKKPKALVREAKEGVSDADDYFDPKFDEPTPNPYQPEEIVPANPKAQSDYFDDFEGDKQFDTYSDDDIAGFYREVLEEEGIIEPTQAMQDQLRNSKIEQTFDPALSKNSLNMYSAVEEALLDSKIQGWQGTGYSATKMATGADILKMLRKTSGIKKEELDVLGLEDFLSSKDKFSQIEVVDYVRDNQIKLIEKRTTESRTELPEHLIDDEELRYLMGETDTLRYEGDNILSGKHTNYEEVRVLVDDPDIIQKGKGLHFPDDKGQVGFNRMSVRELETLNGEKLNTAFIEEIQTDVHSKGAEHGYLTKEEAALPLSDIVDKYKKVSKQSKKSFKKLFKTDTERYSFGQKIQQALTETNEKEVEDLMDLWFDRSTPSNFLQYLVSPIHPWGNKKEVKKVRGLFIERDKERGTSYVRESDELRRLDARVPPIPYKGDAWLKLMFENALQKAVREGRDAIAWPTARVLTSRYGIQSAKLYQNIYNSKLNKLAKKALGTTPEAVERGEQVIRKDVGGFEYTSDPFVADYYIIKIPKDKAKEIRTKGTKMFSAAATGLAGSTALSATQNEGEL